MPPSPAGEGSLDTHDRGRAHPRYGPAGRPQFAAWEILKDNGIEPLPHRDRQTWTVFLCGQARPGTWSRISKTGSAAVKYLIRDRDSKYATAFDTVLQNEGIAADATYDVSTAQSVTFVIGE